MNGPNVAIVGATGVVGQELIQILESRKFPLAKLRPLASKRSAGSTVSFNGDHIEVETLTHDSFKDIDIALFSAGGSISAEFAPSAVKAGATVIDNTSHFRMDPDVPLVVPEVNEAAIKSHKGIIANPNCSTAQMVLALNPIHQKATIKRVVVSTYQSVSGAGKPAITELETQSRVLLSGGRPAAEVFQKDIGFNVIPQIDVFLDNGYTKEEWKMIEETKKILGDDQLSVTATCVRVPVFIGHSEAINIETEHKLSAKDVRALLSTAPGVKVTDNPATQEYPTPKEIAGEDPTFIGRIREDVSRQNGIELWCVADNLRKGAALNAIQIAEALLKI